MMYWKTFSKRPPGSQWFWTQNEKIYSEFVLMYTFTKHFISAFSKILSITYNSYLIYLARNTELMDNTGYANNDPNQWMSFLYLPIAMMQIKKRIYKRNKRFSGYWNLKRWCAGVYSGIYNPKAEPPRAPMRRENIYLSGPSIQRVSK